VFHIQIFMGGMQPCCCHYKPQHTCLRKVIYMSLMQGWLLIERKGTTPHAAYYMSVIAQQCLWQMSEAVLRLMHEQCRMRLQQ
jgi:hypothetical protein